MLIDILSTTNYAQYNVKLAHIIGLEAAIYINQLININEKAVRKSKLKEGYMKLKRSYITERTTFSKSKQLQIESNLVDLGLILKDPCEPDLVSVDTGTLTSLVVTEDEDLIKDISKIAKKKPDAKEIKGQEDIIRLKECIHTDNDELRKAYYDWIDAAYMRSKYLSPKAVAIAQRQVDAFSDRDLDIALGLLEFAAMHGYCYMTRAIEAYKKAHSNIYQINAAQLHITGDFQQVLGEDIF